VRKRLDEHLSAGQPAALGHTPFTPSSSAVRRAVELQQRVAGLRAALAQQGGGSRPASPTGVR